jgi:NhaP-type Na+/H+ or K+/H+ antiporter
LGLIKLKLIKNNIGTEKGIPTLILTGASIDDVFAITMFSAFLGLYSGAHTNIGIQLLNIPISIILGIIIGLTIGFLLIRIFNRYQIRDTKKVLLILAFSILLNGLESVLKTKLQIASLLGVMTIGFIIIEKLPDVGEILSRKFNRIWVFAEILLFVLVGAQVNINIAVGAGKIGAIIILIGLFGRSIGAVPLSLGVESGDIILAISVLSILITAPLGAIGINVFAKSLLDRC